MKIRNFIINLSLILIAFAIGVSISNSCASDDTDFLTQDDVDQAAGLFRVDELWFHMDGTVASRIKNETVRGEFAICLEEAANYDGVYSYDEKGRLLTISCTYADAEGHYYLKKSYSYSGKTIVETCVYDGETRKKTTTYY